MPCFCWIAEESVSKELSQIRWHAKEIVRIIREIHNKGDIPQEGSPLPRDLLKDVHCLIDDLLSGKCSEKQE